MFLVLGIGLVVLAVGTLVWRNASYRFPWNVAERDGLAFKVSGAADGGFELGRSPCIGVDTDPTLSFSLFRKSRFTRLLGMIGLSREFRTPDHDFDDCVYINSSDRRIGDWLSEDRAARSLVLQVLLATPAQDVRVAAICCLGGVLYVHCRTRDSTYTVRTETLASACLKSLVELNERLQAHLATQPAVPFQPWRQNLLGVLAVISIALPLTASLRIPVYSPFAIVDDPDIGAWAIAAVAVTSALLISGMVMLSKRGAVAKLGLVGLGLLPWLGLPSTVRPLLTDANEEFDGAPGVTYTAQVGPRVTRADDMFTATRFVLSLSDWRGGARPVKVSVSADAYRRIDKSNRVAVTVRPGLLGVPWISDIHRMDDGARCGESSSVGC